MASIFKLVHQEIMVSIFKMDNPISQLNPNCKAGDRFLDSFYKKANFSTIT